MDLYRPQKVLLVQSSKGIVFYNKHLVCAANIKHKKRTNMMFFKFASMV